MPTPIQSITPIKSGLPASSEVLRAKIKKTAVEAGHTDTTRGENEMIGGLMFIAHRAVIRAEVLQRLLEIASTRSAKWSPVGSHILISIDAILRELDDDSFDNDPDHLALVVAKVVDKLEARLFPPQRPCFVCGEMFDPQYQFADGLNPETDVCDKDECIDA